MNVLLFTVPSVGDALGWLLDAAKWLLEHLLLLIISGLVIITMAVFFRLRRSVLFKAWANQTGDTDLDVGRGLADLLLFMVRDIHGVHNRAPEAGFWNQYRDVPAFRYEIDSNVALLASTDLGPENRLASAIMTVLFNMVPLIFQPAEVRGSIQRFDNEIQLMVALEGYRRPGRRSKRVSRVWSRTVASITTSDRQQPVEELAYELYLEMAGAKFFKSAQAFSAYTAGLRSHLAFLDLDHVEDRKAAEREYKNSIKLDSGAAPARYNLAALLYFEYDADANKCAISELLRVISVNDPELQASARSALANCYLQEYHRYGQNNPELLIKATDYARQALRDAKHMDAVHKALGFAYHQRSEFEADRLAHRHVAQRPPRYLDRTWYHDVFWVRRCRRRAIRHYKRAVRRNKRHYVAINNLGNLYLKWGERVSGRGPLARLQRRYRIKTSMRWFEKSISLRPIYHHAHDNLGNAFLALGRYDDAERSFKTALEHEGDYAEAKNDIARLYLLRAAENGTDKQSAVEEAAEWRRQAAERHRDAITTPRVVADQQRKLCLEVASGWSRTSGCAVGGAEPPVCPFRGYDGFAPGHGGTVCHLDEPVGPPTP